MASFAHNVFKIVRKLGRGVGSPGPRSPIDAITASEERATADMVKNSIALPRCFAWPTWLAVYFRPAFR